MDQTREKIKNINEIKDLSQELGTYHNEWVALSGETSAVVSRGKSLEEVLKEAREAGEKDPVITRIPKEYGNFVL